MGKVRRYGCVIGVVLCGTCPCWATRRAAVAPTAPANIVVDGVLDDWRLGLDGAAPPIPLGAGTSQLESGAISNDADHSAQIFVTHTPSSLLVAAVVTDDHVVGQFHGGDIWRGDLLEVLLESRGPQGYLHVGISPTGDVWIFSKGGHPAERQIHGAGRIRSPGYAIELEIPFSAFGFPPMGKSLAINFAARDVDPGEDPPAYRMWSGYRHQTVGTFGSLVLLDRAGWPPSASRLAPWPSCPKPREQVRVEAPLAARGTQLYAGTRAVRLRLVNYQSALKNWVNFWTEWDPAQVERDLSLAARLGVNALRVFVFTDEFGGANVRPSMVARLSSLLDLARQHGMVCVVTFFPFKKEFATQAWPEMEAHLRGVVSQFRGDPAVAMWDLMNEADHGWALPSAKFSKAQVRAWAEHMANAVRSADPTHLVTIGLAGHFANHQGPIDPDELLGMVDVLSLHWFFEPASLRAGLARARQALAAPMILQEFGLTGLYFGDREVAAAYTDACTAAQEASLAGFGAWELFDHPVGSIAWAPKRDEEIPENYFGVLRVDGTAKPAAEALCHCLAVPALRVGPRR